ncbi:YlbF family regulator [Lactococcus lactis]|nr:YlbF family regulator [Lactococcus lactis]
MHYDDLVDLLVEKIKSLDYVKDFQQAETALMANQELFKAQEEMKALQKRLFYIKKLIKYRLTKRLHSRLKSLKNGLSIILW